MRILLWILILIPVQLLGQQSDSTKTEQAFKVVPLVTSSPLLGWGLGVSTSYLYNADGSKASKSQLNIGGQYSTTKSYTLFANNNFWLNDNRFLSSSTIAYSDINNEFEDKYFGDVQYKTNSLLIAQILMYKIANNIYAGPSLSYKRLAYTPNNLAGEDFINENAIIDENTGGYGISTSYDSRKNKYYPSSSAWVALSVNNNPEWLGAVDNYYSFVVNARYYAKGFKTDDVWAWQLYGQFSSDKTPDTGLATLSGKSLLRGYPSGQFKAKYLTGGQTEYRYTINNSRFRVTGFFGIANLAGGSFGSDGNSRHNDGWYTAEGLGIRYKIQQVTGVDLRLDFVHNSEGQISFYLAVNQAF